MGVAGREYENILSFYRITISEFDFVIAIVWCVSRVNLIIFLLW